MSQITLNIPVTFEENTNLAVNVVYRNPILAWRDIILDYVDIYVREEQEKLFKNKDSVISIDVENNTMLYINKNKQLRCYDIKSDTYADEIAKCLELKDIHSTEDYLTISQYMVILKAFIKYKDHLKDVSRSGITYNSVIEDLIVRISVK